MSNFDAIKAMMVQQGLPVSPETSFFGKDWEVYRGLSESQHQSFTNASYGAAYTAILPDQIAEDAQIEKIPTLPSPPDPIAWNIRYNQPLPEEATDSKGHMVKSKGNPGHPFVLLTDGTLNMGMSLRYRRSGITIPMNGLEYTIPRTDTQGNAWAVAVSISTPRGTNVLSSYQFYLYWRTVEGVPQNIRTRLTLEADKYVAPPFDMNSGELQAAQEIIPALTERDYPQGGPALTGKYKIGIECLRLCDRKVAVLEITVTAKE